jgi:misacylated tRNA(Ala) deacylase
MSENLCYTDAYRRSVEAAVVSVEPGAADGAGVQVVLDRTVFYPGGGGQPADHGWLRAGDRTWAVRTARKAGDDVVHELEPGAEPPVVGESVTAEIDWERRHALMRTHTALHTLCGVVWRDHHAPVTGGNMEPGSGRMDFEFESMSGELVGSIEERVNAELAAARDVRVKILPRDEAFAIPDLIRTKVNLLPPGISEIRTIEIVGLDLQADGGTHVANTREVGSIHVTGYESKGRINKRIRLELVAPEG